uniref:Transmembrane protease serine 9 n=1 Tax=Lygus hesperus TaxID=30085 RepID=A0A0A9Z1J3_LYGHE
MPFDSSRTNSVHPRYSILILLNLVQHNLAADPVIPANYPFFTTVISDEQATCGASLITTSYLLTACHCLLVDPNGDFKYPHVLQKPEKIRVEAGNESKRPAGLKSDGKMTKVHPKCEGNATSVVYNYGVIEIVNPFPTEPGYIEVVVDFFDQKELITHAIMNHENLTCFALDFEITMGQHAFWDLGTLLRDDMILEMGDWCMNILKDFKLNFDPNIQVCATRTSPIEDCNKTNTGGPLICGFEFSLFIGLWSGRHHPYCGKVVPPVFSRLDIAFDWIREAIPPDPVTSTIITDVTTTQTTSTVRSSTQGPTDPTLTTSHSMPTHSKGTITADTDPYDPHNSCSSVPLNFLPAVFISSLLAVVTS